LTPLLALTKGPSPLWYLTRGTGLVSLLLLTAVMLLGLLQVSRWSSPLWPRFVVQGLHRNLSLLVLVVVALHIVTAELDTFAPVGWLAAAVPFMSAYRPIWLGLGTVAFDLLLALLATSLLRPLLGYRAWRPVHWAAYACWPVAFVHGLGTGTDTRLGWVVWLSWACAGAVVAAAGWRLAKAWPGRPGARLGAAGAVALGMVAVSAWAALGPLQPGWARRAGTPVRLLTSTTRPPAAAGGGTGAERTASR
jgi:hypothetical protein